MIVQIKLKADVKLSVKADGVDGETLSKRTEAEIILRFEQFLNSMSKIELDELEQDKERVSVYPRFHLWYTK